VGQAAREQGIEQLWCAGAAAADAARAYGPAARHFATTAELVAALGERPVFASVLVKGSRFMKMEQVVAALQTIAAGRTPMLLSLAQWLQGLYPEQFGFLRVFQYLTFRP
jgi:hypothetical protein